MALIERHVTLISDRKAGPALPVAGGDDKYDGMDGWQTSVENRLTSLDTRVGSVGDKVDKARSDLIGRMDTQFYITWGGIIAGFLGMAYLMAKGFHWL